MATITIENVILAVVTMHADKVTGASAVFIAQTQEEMQQISFSLEKILDGIAHEVKPGIIIIVRH